MKKYTDEGFSLLELVVAVSIMLILGIVGFVSYQSYTDNARQAALETSANQVLTAVVAEHNTPTGDPAAAVNNFNATAGEIVTNITTANEHGLTVRAESCDGGYSVAKTAGNFSGLDTTGESLFTYEWLGTPRQSQSAMYGCDGEVLAMNLATDPVAATPTESLNEIWGTNNALEMHRERTTVDDHPMGITTAMESRLSDLGVEKQRDNFLSYHKTGGLENVEHDYFGIWVWANVDTYASVGKRSNAPEDVHFVEANTWTFLTADDGRYGVTLHFTDDIDDPASAIGRITGAMGSNQPIQGYFDGDTP